VTSSTERQEVAAPSDATGRRAIVVCDQWLGSNGYAGMKALRRAGWSVQVVPEWEFVPVRWRSLPMRALGRLVRGRAVREFNAQLIRVAKRLAPEMLLVFKGTFVTAATLHALRERGVRSYCFFPDVSTRTHGRYLPEALPAYDLVFTTKRFGVADLEALGVGRIEVLHHAFDPDLHRPVPLAAQDLDRYGCAVSFIGTWSPKKERYLQALRTARPEVSMRIWGAQWDRARSRELRNVVGGHTVEGEEYVRAIRSSTINLALLSEQRPGASAGDQVTSRSFHIPAAGGFMLHERTPELLELLREGVEVACFDGEAELAEAVGRWLSDPAGRERIAKAGSSIVRKSHGWDSRIRELLDHLPASRLGSE
jgi:glycosyltransferase involved in cell wall biosynthesis